MSTLLKLEDLHLSFQGREVVHGVSFDIHVVKNWRWWANPARAKPSPL